MNLANSSAQYRISATIDVHGYVYIDMSASAMSPLAGHALVHRLVYPYRRGLCVAYPYLQACESL